MRIHERQPCPRCGNKRILERARGVYVCFQCRYGWSTDADTAPSEPAGTELLAELPELRERLIAYRDAIRAGLFTDWPTTTSR